jgi:hypothetical protein
MPTDDRPLKIRVVVSQEEAKFQRVYEPDVGEMSGSGKRSRRITAVERTSKASVRMAF